MQQFRGWINVEFLLLFAVALLRPDWGTATLLLADLTLAVLEPLARLYYFSPGDALVSLRYLDLLPMHRLLGEITVPITR